MTKIRKRQRVQTGAGPRTRGQANLLANENQKRGTVAASVPVEVFIRAQSNLLANLHVEEAKWFE